MIVMRVNSFSPTNFACLLRQIPCLDSSLHGKMSIVLNRVCSAPVSLTGIRF
ncbi:hypothetical protein ShzoTeo12_38810 (plasmid) [Shinella zoogloeoides]|nr:hypothetical protein ShzoTeo12_38810 [Shinella zoogloeoides]